MLTAKILTALGMDARDDDIFEPKQPHLNAASGIALPISAILPDNVACICVLGSYQLPELVKVEQDLLTWQGEVRIATHNDNIAFCKNSETVQFKIDIQATHKTVHILD